MSSTGENGDGGDLLCRFGRIIHPLKHSSFGVSLDKGNKSNKDIKESTGSLILYRDLPCSVSPKRLLARGGVRVNSRVDVSKMGGYVLFCLFEAGVDILLFGANGSNRLFVCIGAILACMFSQMWDDAGDRIFFSKRC